MMPMLHCTWKKQLNYKERNSMNKNLLVFYMFLFLIFSGCKNSSENPEIKNKLFDFSAYFSAEAKRLESANATLEKTLLKNNKSERLVIENPDWQAELNPFTDISLNKPAIASSYKTDSLRNENSLQITYSAMDESAPVKNVVLYFSKSEPDSIIIIKATNTIYYTLTEELRYSKKQYSIDASTQPKAGKAIQFSLTGIITE
jgi:hypothetical protein